MYNPACTNFDVSVILTLYKRPENLGLQLEAIKNQTLKPREILLFQDILQNGDKAIIHEDLKKEFDVIEVVKENIGVWGRFEFAKRKAKSKYVCVFDDDTIPGSSWLENCLSNMQEEEGIYGTIGILMKNPKNYPYKDYVRLGWDAAIERAIEIFEKL